MTGKPTDPNNLSSAFRSAAPYINVVYVFISSVLMFGAAGWWLDSEFDTQPLLIIIGLFAGLISGFYYLLKVIKQLERSNR
jgi:F0F1-type ATP synthase assembly protein I